MRNARSVAWFSTAGFHQRSKWTTCEAAVRLRPVPPALIDITKKGGPSSRWKSATKFLRFLTAVPPCRTRPSVPKTVARYSASGSVISRNCVKTRAFSPRDAISAQSEPSRSNLALADGS